MSHNKFFCSIFTTILLMALSDHCFGQNFNKDSLLNALSQSSTDTTRAMVLAKLAEGYVFYKPDSTFYYATRGIEHSREINFTKGEAWCTFWLAVYYRFTGSPVQAMQLATRALSLFEHSKTIQGEILSYQLIGWTAQDNEDFNRAMDYHLKAARLSEQNGNFRLFYSYGTIAEMYLEFSKPDTALLFAERAIKVMDAKNGYPFEVLARAHARLSQNDSARYYYRQAIATHRSTNSTIGIYSSNYGLANLFADENQLDSAISYASVAYDEAKGNNFSLAFGNITKLLSTLYSQKNIKDSTIKYLQISVNVKDSLFSLNKVRQFQSLVFSEKLQEQEMATAISKSQVKTRTFIFLIVTGFISVLAFILFRNNKIKQKANNQLTLQKKEVENAYDLLKTTQTQLIQSAKMASLGELTAGIAHEIQNPLNFVNNFSEVNAELIDDLKKELAAGNRQYAEEIADSIKKNEEKISHHGKRADGIVRGMLEHSRTSSVHKELTDINSICEEYLRLAYHGYRAKNKSFNADFRMNADDSIPRINVVPGDIGRVILNLVNNAFHAVREAATTTADKEYEPTVTISTKRLEGRIEIRVKDNGNGIADAIKEKIFQPFYTTKPTGQGTGLGLSLAYDIVKAHGGRLEVITTKGKGAEFIVTLPEKT